VRRLRDVGDDESAAGHKYSINVGEQYLLLGDRLNDGAQRRHYRVGRLIHVAPGPGGQIEGPGLKAPTELGQPFLRSAEHFGRTIGPVHGVHGKAVEHGFREQPFAAAHLDDSLQLPLALGDDMTSVVDEYLGNFSFQPF
jgi:hypothetical protein